MYHLLIIMRIPQSKKEFHPGMVFLAKTAQKGVVSPSLGSLMEYIDFGIFSAFASGERDQIKWHIKEKEYNITFGQVYDSVTIGEAKPALPSSTK